MYVCLFWILFYFIKVLISLYQEAERYFAIIVATGSGVTFVVAVVGKAASDSSVVLSLRYRCYVRSVQCATCKTQAHYYYFWAVNFMCN